MDNAGQYFTVDSGLRETVSSLILNRGKALEPSAGEGHLVREIEGIVPVVAIDIDSSLDKVCDTNIIHCNFFDYKFSEKFDTIFGNPPYVKYRNSKNIIEGIDSILSSCNLFYYFIEKCISLLSNRGELIFIIPREFFNSTRAIPLRKMMYSTGTITNIVDYGEDRVFKGVSPSVIIIRFEKGNSKHITNYCLHGNCTDLNEHLVAGSYVFTNSTISSSTLSDVFNIKVGLVTGLNRVFEMDSLLSIDVICSDYVRSMKKRRFIFADNYKLSEIKSIDYSLYLYLIENKDLLKGRKIKKFNDSNWHTYGAVRNIKLMESGGKCLYVNSKTRGADPFFVDDIGYFDGSVIALYPINDIDLCEWRDKLNNSRQMFIDQGMSCNGKYSFTVNTLKNFRID